MTWPRHSPLVLLLMAAGTLTASASPSRPAPDVSDARAGAVPATMHVLVRTGQPAPDGGTFTEFADPALNDRGDLTFGALTTSPRVHEALYFLTGGRLQTGRRLQTLAAVGRLAPTGGAFLAFNDVVLNDRGTVVFLGRTTDRVAQEGLFLARAGTVAPLVTTGQAALAGGVFTDFANPTLNAQEVVAFVGRTTGRVREGIFTISEGSTAPVVLNGDGAPTGGAFEFFLDGTPAQNDRGQIAFIASTTEHATQGVYVLVGGHPVSIVTTDDDAPVGGKFTEFGSVTLTGAGTVGFIGRTAQSSIREGLYVTGRAGLVLLAYQGQAVSGTILTTFANATMNEGEEVVFQLASPDPIPRAIFLATRAGVAPIVQAGDPAPGGGRFTAFSTPALNDHGEIAFIAETNDGHHGIYLVSLR